MMTPLERAAYEKWLIEGCQRFGFELLVLIAKQRSNIMTAAAGRDSESSQLAQQIKKTFNDSLIRQGGENVTRHFERN